MQFKQVLLAVTAITAVQAANNTSNGTNGSDDSEDAGVQLVGTGLLGAAAAAGVALLL